MSTGKQKRVVIYTDGACVGNPGPGGYGVVLLDDSRRVEISGGFRLTTNNRMEMMAAIVGLEALNGQCRVTVYTDSQYLVNAIMRGWARRWKANDWYRNKDQKAQNIDLLNRLLDLCDQHDVEFVWVRGHAGNPENERCNYLARNAAQQKNLLPDRGYEQDKTW